MTVNLLRASHANEYELQNYYPIAEKYNIHLITSHNPLTSTNLPTIKLWSPSDLPKFPMHRQLLNRLIGGEQWLVGLEKIIHSTDIIHTAETYTPYTHQAVQLRKLGKLKKLICTCWETIPHNNEKFSRLVLWKQEAYKYVDIFHTPTNRAKIALVSEGVDPSKIIVIPYGVDLSRFKHTKPNPKNRKPIILTLARRVPEKGYSLWQHLSNDLKGLADFRWVSDAPYSQVPKLLSECDIFFLPSLTTSTWEEQYGMALVEAMVAGLPIVTTTSGAIPEIVGSTALLADPNNINNLKQHLSSLIKDKDLRSNLSKESLKRASKFDSRSISFQLAKLYSS